MQVDWLILADAAHVVGGKLYLLGGGWDVLTVNSGFPVQYRCAVAVEQGHEEIAALLRRHGGTA